MMRRFFLRFHMSLILAGVLMAGVLSNKALFALGFESFLARYPVSVIVAYLAFFALVRIWLLYAARSRSRRGSSSLDPGDLGNLDISSGSSGSPSDMGSFIGGGGRSGGGGASAGWGGGSGSSIGGSGSGGGGSLDLDIDGEGAVILIIFAVLIAAIFGSGIYLFWQGPEILSEVLFQVALSTGLIRSVRRIDQPDWMGSVFRLTRVPFAIVLVVATIFGGAARIWCPSANRIADVWAHGCKAPESMER